MAMTGDALSSGPDFLGAKDPIALFDAWFSEARETELRDANAVGLATVDEAGMPNLRTVLIKDHGADGFTWYTNYTSAKGRELAAHPHACLCFYWKSLGRQVRIRGPVGTVSDAEADAYFTSRARDSQLGAWASLQSADLSSRDELEKRLQECRERFSNADVPRPSHWSGFRLVPRYIEFWQERPFRLHDRLVFTREGEGWSIRQLYP